MDAAVLHDSEENSPSATFGDARDDCGKMKRNLDPNHYLGRETQQSRRRRDITAEVFGPRRTLRTEDCRKEATCFGR